MCRWQACFTWPAPTARSNGLTRATAPTWSPSSPVQPASELEFCGSQGVTSLSVQSSVSLQHLPVDAASEAGNLPPALLGRLSFATQKLGEIVRAAARAADGSGIDAGAQLFTPGAQAHAPPS